MYNKVVLAYIMLSICKQLQKHNHSILGGSLVYWYRGKWYLIMIRTKFCPPKIGKINLKSPRFQIFQSCWLQVYRDNAHYILSSAIYILGFGKVIHFHPGDRPVRYVYCFIGGGGLLVHNFFKTCTFGYSDIRWISWFLNPFLPINGDYIYGKGDISVWVIYCHRTFNNTQSIDLPQGSQTKYYISNQTYATITNLCSKNKCSLL